MMCKKESVFNVYITCISLLFALSVLLTSCVSSKPEFNQIQPVQKANEGSSDELGANLTVTENDKLASTFPRGGSSVTQNYIAKVLKVKIFVVNQARNIDFVKTAVRAANSLFEKCQITLNATIDSIALAPDTSIDREARDQIVAQYGRQKPALFVIPATAERDVAFTYLPSLDSGVAATSWLTDRVSDRCFVWIMVHELGHVILDHRGHNAGFNNIMSVACKHKNWGSRRIAPDWTDEQCVELRHSNAVTSINVKY